MSYKKPLSIAALTLAALAPAPAASAASLPAYPLVQAPPDEVQHTVTATTFQSNETVPGTTPWDRIEERWVSTTASRSVLTNAENGELISECTGTPTTYSCYDANEDGGLLLSGTGGLNIAAGQSWETEGGRIEFEIARGWLHPTGSTTFLGRPAETYVGTGEHAQLAIVVDAASDYPLQVTVTLSEGEQEAKQVSTVTAFEILSPATAAPDLAPKAHPGARGSRVKRGPSAKPRAPGRHGRHKQHRGRGRHGEREQHAGARAGGYVGPMSDKQTTARR
jgi:hypothetical protein